MTSRNWGWCTVTFYSSSELFTESDTGSETLLNLDYSQEDKRKDKKESLKRNRIMLSSIFKRPHFDMTECSSELSYNFYSRRSLLVQFSDLELSSDAGILLARQAEETV